jgi:OOP family OmpA-OmpF porin
MDKGVDAERIMTRGEGPDSPIADNKTAAGRQLNRRIEFQIIK